MNRILYIERKSDEFVSIERVFRQVAKNISGNEFETNFQKVRFGNSILGIFKNLLLFRKQKAEIYHITGHIHYLALISARKNTVLTIHDLRFLQTNKRIRRYLLKKLFLDLPVKKLQYITAISQTTKTEIIAATNCQEQKIRVIENPLDEQYKPPKEVPKFNKTCPTILQIGTMANKNIPRLIEALEGINCRLIIIGKLEEKQIKLLNLKGIVYENKFNLSDPEVRMEYEKADLVTFCSTYEGFGLPIIESQAMLKPVITSNLSPLKEVSGKGAVLVDPFDCASIREGILKIINDDKYRKQLINFGKINVERFDPQIIAKQYASLYREILITNKNVGK